jgi:hypothetical protein
MTEQRNEGVHARRGDLVLIEAQQSYDPAPRYTFERVAGITSDGMVKVCEARAFGAERREPLFRLTSSRGRKVPQYRVGYRMHWVLPAVKVDAAALWAAWVERPGEWAPEPFASFEDAQRFASQFKRRPAAT